MTTKGLFAFAATTLGAVMVLAWPGLIDSANAQTWPQRTVKFIIPLGPGSGADIGARLLADRFNKSWGQPVVVENRPGGDAMVAIGAFTQANDDHVLLYAPSSSFAAHPYLHSKMPYDPADMVPVARATNTIVSFAVPTIMNAKTVGDVVALARAEPGKLNWAAITGLNDFLFQSFTKETGLNIARVPYRDPVQALNDLAENRIHIYSAAFAITRPQVEAGKVKVLAIVNSTRADALPGIPTVREAGFPALEFDGLVGFYGPKTMSVEARARLAADVAVALKDPIIIDRLTKTGQVVNPGNAAEFASNIEAQRRVAAAAGKALGVKAAEFTK